MIDINCSIYFKNKRNNIKDFEAVDFNKTLSVHSNLVWVSHSYEHHLEEKKAKEQLEYEDKYHLEKQNVLKAFDADNTPKATLR